MTDDDAYDRHRDRSAERGPWPRRSAGNGDYERNQRRDAIEKLERPWMRKIMLETWPW